LIREGITRAKDAKAGKDYREVRGGGEERKFAAKIGIVQRLGLSGE
jgi:hypothetical protein